MSSTTTQGHGPGGAFDNKGPENGRNVYVPLVGPRILTAGTMVMTGSAIKVQCPGAVGLATTDVSVFLGPVANPVTITKHTDANSVIDYITLNGTSPNSVDFIVVLNGLGA